jgi:hypothetical protein
MGNISFYNTKQRRSCQSVCLFFLSAFLFCGAIQRILVLSFSAYAQDLFTMMSYNLLNYDTGVKSTLRDANFRTVIQETKPDMFSGELASTRRMILMR